MTTSAYTSNLLAIIGNRSGSLPGNAVAALELSPGVYSCILQLAVRPGSQVPAEMEFWDSFNASVTSTVSMRVDSPSITTSGARVSDGRGALVGNGASILYSFTLSIPSIQGKFFLEFRTQPSVKGGAQRDLGIKRLEFNLVAGLTPSKLAGATTAPTKVLLPFIGQSGLTGFAAFPGADLGYGGEDAPVERMSEISQGFDTSPYYYAAPAGELQMARCPLQDGVARDGAGVIVDDGAGNPVVQGVVSPTFHAGKAYLKDNPEIEHLVLLSDAIPNTGFTTGTWGVDDDHYEAFKGRVTTFLAANPTYEIPAIVWRGGETDSLSTDPVMTPEDWLADFLAMIADFRTAVATANPSLRDIPVIVVGMASFNVAPVESTQAIDAVQKALPSTLYNCYYLDPADLTNTLDGRHNEAGDNRELGKRIADALNSIVDLPAPIHRMTYDAGAGEFTDEIGTGRIYGQSIVDEGGTHGEVMDFLNNGTLTSSLQCPAEAYTLHYKFKATAAGSSFRNISSGKRDNQYLGRIDSLQVFWHQSTAASPGRAILSPNVGAYTVGVWFDRIVSWDGTRFREFKDGVEAVLPFDGEGLEGLSGPQTIEFGGWMGDVPGNAGVPMRLDFYEVYDFAITTEAEAARLAAKDPT